MGKTPSKLPLSQKPRLSAFHLPQVASCLVRYTTKKRPVINEMVYITEERHALHQPYKETYLNRRDDRLHTLISGHDIVAKCVVRNFAAKRLRAAFRETMAQNGYTQDGARSDGQPGVLGTLELFATAAAIKMKYGSLRAEMVTVLQHLQRKSRDMRHSTGVSFGD